MQGLRVLGAQGFHVSPCDIAISLRWTAAPAEHCDPSAPCSLASARAFRKQRRSMGAPDLLAELGAVADELAAEGADRVPWA